jgi:hypothetical protein
MAHCPQPCWCLWQPWSTAWLLTPIDAHAGILRLLRRRWAAITIATASAVWTVYCKSRPRCNWSEQVVPSACTRCAAAPTLLPCAEPSEYTQTSSNCCCISSICMAISLPVAIFTLNSGCQFGAFRVTATSSIKSGLVRLYRRVSGVRAGMWEVCCVC